MNGRALSKAHGSSPACDIAPAPRLERHSATMSLTASGLERSSGELRSTRSSSSLGISSTGQ
eukprot:1019231-Prorocentrum_lima.AAC.1